MAQRDRTADHTRHLVVFAAIISVILVVSALKAVSIVMIPLAWAVFAVALVRPMQSWLQQRIPHWAALILTFATVTAAIGLFGYALAESVDQVAEKAPEYSQRFVDLYHNGLGWLDQRGIAVDSTTISRPQGASGQVLSLLGGIWGFLGMFVMVIALLLLSLSEVGVLRRKLRNNRGNSIADKILEASQDAAARVRRYMSAVLLTSLGTGLSTGLFTWAIGLDFAFVWAMLAFLLNFIPTIGSVIAVVPPVLVALVMPGEPWLAPVTLAGLSVIQIAFGYYIDPLVQGRMVQLSPLVVLLSMMFWGWVWGIAGAFLSVPLTVAIAAFCRHWESTEWIGYLLSEDE